MTRSTQVLVIGAGLSGLTAAKILQREGFEVLVVEKSRGVGGRMATRRIGEAVFDHGAQFITVRDSEFARAMAAWNGSGSAKEWFRSTGSGGGHTRYRGNPSMTAIAHELSRSLDVRLSTRVISLALAGAQWTATMEAGETIATDAIILTAPVPQSLALLDAGQTANQAILPGNIRHELESISYEHCIAVMALLEKTSALPEQGWAIPKNGPVAWMADNQAKGISPLPAVTIHAKAGFSEKHWETDRIQVGEQLILAAEQWLGCAVKEFQVHGWRYSKPVGVHEQRCVGTRPASGDDAAKAPPVVFAGDAFGGPRVEGAFLSGRAAARHIMKESLQDDT